MWPEYLLGAGVGYWTAISYMFASLFLFWPGWKLTGKIKRGWLRILLRASVVTIVFAPGVLVDPAVVFTEYAPALLVTIYYILEGYPADFWLGLGLSPLLVIWFLAVVWFMIFIAATGAYGWWHRNRSINSQ